MIKAGFIGLGAMGTPMARNIAKKDRLTAIWNRTQSTAAALAEELGVHCVSSPTVLAAEVDVVLICVSADADVLDMVRAILPGLRAGQVVIDLSTVSSDTAQTAAGLVRSSGADFLDAPVTGGVEGARCGTLSIMVGGAADTLERARPILEPMGRRIIHMGEVGMGQAAKAVNQVMCAGINQAVTEALNFGTRLGLDMDRLIDAISGGAAGNWFLDKRGPTMVRGVFEPGFRLALHHKDLRICKAMAHRLDTPLPLVEATLNDYARLIAEGHGDEDISALFRLKRPPL